jgi:hypothetical protein
MISVGHDGGAVFTAVLSDCLAAETAKSAETAEAAPAESAAPEPRAVS